MNNIDIKNNMKNKIIIENKEQLNEGWKEVVLGTLMLMGIDSNIKSQNTDILNNTETLKNIENTLKSDKINTLIDKLETIGFEDAKEQIINNKKTLEQNFNEYSKRNKLDLKLKIKNLDDIDDVGKEIKKGYTVSKVEININEPLPKGDLLVVEEIKDIEISGDLFETAKYELNDSIKNELTEYIKTIYLHDGKITEVYIESSTDKEPIKMGNDMLSRYRAKSIKDIFTEIDDDINFNINLKPNSGPDIYSKTMSDNEREKSRIETSDYRYVKVKIKALIPDVANGSETLPEMIGNINVTLVKSFVLDKSKTNKKYVVSKKTPKCKIIKRKGKKIKCPKF